MLPVWNLSITLDKNIPKTKHWIETYCYKATLNVNYDFHPLLVDSANGRIFVNKCDFKNCSMYIWNVIIPQLNIPILLLSI